jgi:hypothetical protein
MRFPLRPSSFAIVRALALRVFLVCAASACGGAPPTPPDVDTEDDAGPPRPSGRALRPTPDAPWTREEVSSPGSVTFTEISFHGAGDDPLEWIELHNPMALDLDVSGWSLRGAVDWVFPEGTILPAGGYVVVANAPTDLPGALGPFSRALANEGERIDLVNNAHRRIDSVAYGVEEPWPVGSDGSGFTLAKIDPDAPSDRAESWTVSAERGGTPGRSNQLDPSAPPVIVPLVAFDGAWSYDASGEAPPLGWGAPGFDDSAWDRGTATFFAGGGVASAPATIFATADNFYALYLGEFGGGDLRQIGEDADANWTSVERFDVTVWPGEHLFFAAWEDPVDWGGPQMAIAEIRSPTGRLGTSASTFEATLGPAGAAPGPLPPSAAPDVAEIAAVARDADAGGAWSPPAAEADASSGPWGGTLGRLFSVGTRYVWPDTFDDPSLTNTESTYALLRTVEPLLGAPGETELVDPPTTVLFRAEFLFDADPRSADLSLRYLVDDGAVVYLNGVEVHRVNLPPGPLSPDTLAIAEVDVAEEAFAALPNGALARGRNVVSVEVHQARADDADLTFAASLSARVSPLPPSPGATLSELAAGGGASWGFELRGVRDGEAWKLVSSTGEEWGGPALPAGELRWVDGAGLKPGDAVFLMSEDGSALWDAARVRARPRARDEAGAWRTPTQPTPGAPNAIERVDDVVIHEIQYHRAPISAEGVAFAERDDEWIELFHRGTDAIDLSGWQLVDAVAFTFPEGTTLQPGGYLVVARDAAAMRVEHPGIAVIGDFDGRLGNDTDRIVLRDARGDLVDEVRYTDDGRWPSAADGGGSTLELRDAFADNAAAEAWGASDEGRRAQWATYRYRGVAEPSVVGPDGTWEELVLGMLDAGEVLLDDVHVVADPGGVAREMVANGGFDAAPAGARWRLLGNHRHSEIVPDPEDPSNPVLRLVATGSTGHMHNHAETTLLRPARPVEVEVSFRARWVSGSNQVHSRLYFNRMPRTTLVAQPNVSGTPGAANSVAVARLGPTFSDLRQDVAVPAPGQAVRVHVAAWDPDGVASAVLWSSVAGAGWRSTPMTEASPGAWEGLLEGQPAGTLVQFYVEAVDGGGAAATFPAAGRASRALVTFDDGRASSGGLHNVRVLLTPEDSAWLHEDVNLMSDDLIGGTVIYDESKVFYDVGVRAKGSERGRPEQARLGYGLVFSRERPFRGSHTSALIDRSEGIGFGQREVLMNLVMARAGSVSAEYNDLAYAMTPLPEHTGPSEIQLDRFTSLVADAQFEDGADGTLFEYELIYFPLTTDDGTPEGLKLPQPDSVWGTPITDLGPDPEAWRWNFLIQSQERRDDYSGALALGRTFAQPTPDLLRDAPAVLDVDQWLRSFAFATVAGAVDNYGGDGSQHNARLYVRPSDQRVLYFPHDLDFFGYTTMPVVGNGDLARLLEEPVYLRAYYGHLEDIVRRAYNEDYLAPWCGQLGALLDGQDFAGHCAFIRERAAWIMTGAPDAVTRRFPYVPFRVTTSAGVTVAAREVDLEGQGWVDVHQIALEGAAAPLSWGWVDATRWRARVPLAPGENALTLVASDRAGEAVGSDTIVVTSTP